MSFLFMDGRLRSNDPEHRQWIFLVILPAGAIWANTVVNGANNTSKPRSDEMKWWRPYLEEETRYCLLQSASGPEIT